MANKETNVILLLLLLIIIIIIIMTMKRVYIEELKLFQTAKKRRSKSRDTVKENSLFHLIRMRLFKVRTQTFCVTSRFRRRKAKTLLIECWQKWRTVSM